MHSAPVTGSSDASTHPSHTVVCVCERVWMGVDGCVCVCFVCAWGVRGRVSVCGQGAGGEAVCLCGCVLIVGAVGIPPTA